MWPPAASSVHQIRRRRVLEWTATESKVPNLEDIDIVGCGCVIVAVSWSEGGRGGGRERYVVRREGREMERMVQFVVA